jgi:hypothetical protein
MPRGGAVYLAQRSASLSRPCVLVSPGMPPCSGATPASTLMPIKMFWSWMSLVKGTPAADFWPRVSSNRMTPLTNSPRPRVVNRISR